MGRFFILGIIFFFTNCQKSDERCGIIIQKIEINKTLYFVLKGKNVDADDQEIMPEFFGSNSTASQK